MFPNTGKTYTSENEKQLPMFQLYIGLFHGRVTPDEHLENWGSEGPILGPFAKVTIEGFKNISGTDMDGNSHEFQVHEDMLFVDGIYYGDWSVFAKFSSPIDKITHDRYPILAYPYNGNFPSGANHGIYIDASNNDPKTALHKRALIGPLTYVHTTYLYHIRLGVNHDEINSVEFNFNPNEENKVDGKFDKIEIFVRS